MTSDPFADPALVARYALDTPRRVPGYADLHRMAQILLAERAPRDARILVLGAGGGLELKAFAEARPDWSFVGLDPSQPMLDLARQVLGPLVSQVDLVKGHVEDVPTGLFDGATCLLTLHFLSVPERLHILRALRTQLKRGAPLIIAHHCNPGAGPIENWLARSAAFAAGPQADVTVAVTSAAAMIQRLPLLTPDGEEALLREAGFTDPALFYAAFSFRGWTTYAGEP